MVHRFQRFPAVWNVQGNNASRSRGDFLDGCSSPFSAHRCRSLHGHHNPKLTPRQPSPMDTIIRVGYLFCLQGEPLRRDNLYELPLKPLAETASPTTAVRPQRFIFHCQLSGILHNKRCSRCGSDQIIGSRLPCVMSISVLSGGGR